MPNGRITTPIRCPWPRRYAADGAAWLHLVDLDGARDPARRQVGSIRALAEGTTLKIQTGGGVRSSGDVETLLDLGAQRVVIGSLCVRDTTATQAVFAKFGAERIVLALDVHGDFTNGFFVAAAGWQEKSALTIEALLDRYKGAVRHVLCTDISKDGKLAGPNLGLYEYLCGIAPEIAFQASGGIASLGDIDQVRDTGVAGVIIGKALYEKRFTVADVMARAA